MIERQHINALKAIVGPKGVITAPENMGPYITEWRDKFLGKTQLVLLPASTKEVARIVRYCNVHGVKIVPQGGNTGLVGGGIPGLEGADEILLSSRRLVSEVQVNANGYSLIATAGTTVTEMQEAAANHDRLFALALASEGSCTAGGITATNAGGVHVIRYGTTRDMLLGIEAVLPDGSIINELSGLRKDNTGFPLSQLLAGSEGTLGFITRVCFKLFPREKTHSTSWVAVPSPKHALELLGMARDICEDQVSVFELMCRDALDFTFNHIPGVRDPLEACHPWYVLLETASSANNSALDQRMQSLLERALETKIILNGTVAQSLDQRHLFWRIRESISEAQKLEGGSIKHDISVPLDRIADFIASATEALKKAYQGARVTPFGHLGDGNLHFNVMQPKNGEKEAFLAHWEGMNKLVHDIVLAHGGSISAEHGIGVLKKSELARTKPTEELDAMRSIKNALDPNGIMNPGCLFD